MIEQRRQEALRQLLGLAVDYGKKRVSAQTGFLHYFGPHAQVHETIPIYDNALFALTLMRTHTSENIAKAKDLLSALLYFQNEEGNFPCNLHEYPQVKDRAMALRLHPILKTFQRDYSHVLGQELRDRLNASLQAMQHCQKQFIQETPQLPLFLKLQTLDEPKDLDISSIDWKTWQPELLAEAALSFYWNHSSIKASSFASLWEHLSNSWHRPTLSYGGPSNKQRQWKYFPQATLYELLMWYLSGEIPARSDLPSLHLLLHAALLPTKISDPIPGIENDAPIRIRTIDKAEVLPDAEDCRFHPFYCLFGSSEKPLTFVSQVDAKTLVKINQKQDNTFELSYALTGDFEDVNDERAMEIGFYIPKPFANITVDGVKATTFSFNQHVAIESENQLFELTFHSDETQGQFIGHIYPGNRPAQCANKEAEKFSAFDWQILLRTLKRDPNAVVVVTVRVK